MKKIATLFIVFSLFFFKESFSQLPDGSLGADFNMQDINGNYYHLYNYLDSGKIVILDFFGTHCRPCWEYHKTRALDKAYKKWGPEGEKKLMVFMIECDGSPDSIIRGKGLNNDNWEDSTDFPIIHTHLPNNNNVTIDYSQDFEPIVYMICPDRRVRYLGFPPPDTALIHFFMDFCPVVPFYNLKLDFVVIDSLKSFSCVNTVNPYVRLQNNGLDTINFLKYYIYLNNVLKDSVEWTGNLSTYKVLKLNISQFTNLSNGSYILKLKMARINSNVNPLNMDSIEYRFTILTTSNTIPFSENFNAPDFPYNGWTINNLHPEYYTWSRIQLPYCNALTIPFSDIPDNMTSEIILPKFDFTNNQTPLLSFDAATAVGRADDYIFLHSSVDCGKNWLDQATYSSNQLKTAPNQTLPFTPDSSQWKRIYLPITTLANKNNVILRIMGRSSNGNNIYFRNIAIDNTASVSENGINRTVTAYPNPATNQVNLFFGNFYKNTEIKVFDLTGREVLKTAISGNDRATIDVESLSTGIYSVHINNDNSIVVIKLSKF